MNPELPLDEQFMLLDELECAEQVSYLEQLSLRAPDDARALAELLQVELPKAQDDAPPTTDLTHGDVVAGHYRVEGPPLGKGSFGKVYKAFDTQMQRYCALKVFDPRTVSKDRVLEEARASARLRSDYVVLVFDVVSDDQRGIFFIAMELCADDDLKVGRSLHHCLTEVDASRRFASRPDAPDDALRLGFEIAQGVAAAHRQSPPVVHGDIKPHNIMLRPSGRAQLIDFGLSVLAPEAPTNARPDQTLTRTLEDGGCARGTPQFMAPEQARGKPSTLRSDVYQLAATLFTVLAGQPPVKPKAKAAFPADDVLRQLSAPRYQVDLRPLRHRGVDSRIVRVLKKAMDPRPEHRHASAREFGADLRALRSQEPTSIDPWHTRAALGYQRNRGRLRVASTFLAVILACGAIIYELDQRRTTADQETHSLEQRLKKAQTEASKASKQGDREEELRRVAEEQAILAETAAADAVSAMAHAEGVRRGAVHDKRQAEFAAAKAEQSALEAEALAATATTSAARDRSLAREAEARAVEARDQADKARGVATAAEGRAAQAEARADAAKRSAEEAAERAASAERDAKDARAEAQTAEDKRRALDKEVTRLETALAEAKRRAAVAEARADEAERLRKADTRLRPGDSQRSASTQTATTAG